MQCFKMLTIVHNGVAHKVPCGKCAFCLVNRRSQWMFRIYHEMRTQTERGYFVTMTYDERHVCRLDDGRLSLRFRDVQLWLKRLRKAGHYVKYIIVGEYGAQTQRPHYHAIIWTSAGPETMQENWYSERTRERLGHMHFGELTMASAMYTLKYIIQPKVKIEDGREPTRAQFSKGLGLGYLTTEVYEWHTMDEERPIFWSVIDGRRVALPRYYRDKIFTKHQRRKEAHRVKWQQIREMRKLMRECKRKGITPWKPYVDGLRMDAQRKILEKTKYSLTI